MKFDHKKKKIDKRSLDYGFGPFFNLGKKRKKGIKASLRVLALYYLFELNERICEWTEKKGKRSRREKGKRKKKRKARDSFGFEFGLEICVYKRQGDGDNC